jgi:hypothetical protein
MLTEALGGSVSLAWALATFMAEGNVAIGTCVSDRIAMRSLSTGGARGTIGAVWGDDGGGTPGAGSNIGLTTRDICNDVGGYGADVLCAIGIKAASGRCGLSVDIGSPEFTQGESIRSG